MASTQPVIESPVLKLSEAAAYCRLSYPKAAELARRGEFPAYRLPGTRLWFVNRDALDAWLLGLQTLASRAAAAAAYDRLWGEIDALDAA